MRIPPPHLYIVSAGLLATACLVSAHANPAQEKDKLIKGVGNAGEWTNDAPGVRHLVRLSDLPQPYATPATGNNPHVLPRPAGAELRVPAGFKVEEYASGLQGPRLIKGATNGDIFVAESGRGRITVLHGASADGRAESSTVWVYAVGPAIGAILAARVYESI